MRTANGEQELMDLIVGLYAETESGQKVAKKLGISPKTVYRLLHTAGVEVPDRHSAIIQERKKKLHGEAAEQVVQSYLDGEKVSDICKRHGVSNYAVYTALADRGIDRRLHGAQARRIREENAREMVRLYREDGLTQVMIAARFGCSYPVVNRVLRQNGIQSKFHASGSDHGSWAGGRHTTPYGYVYVKVAPDDPLAIMRNNAGYVLEHRLIVARWLGRPLTPNESVHHKNGDRACNDLQNLELRVGNHGKGQSCHCADCGSRNIVWDELADPP